MPPLALRSLLFAPGDSEAKMRKAIASPADAVILDLEDAVAPDAKAAARTMVRAVIADETRDEKPVLVRLNALDTGLTLADLAAVMPARPWGVVLPKCEGAADIDRLSFYLDALEARDEIAPGSTRIVTVATETAAATLNLSQASAGSKRLWGLLWGGEDLSACLGANGNRDADGAYTFPYQFARSQCLYAASALGVVAIDAVYPDFRDLPGLEAEAREGLRDGFTAKAAIHPAQIAPINAVMTPRPEQVDWAEKVVDLLAHQAVARLDGRMVDLAHKRVAEKILSRASAALGVG